MAIDERDVGTRGVSARRRPPIVASSDHVGQQSEKARALDRLRELALLLGGDRGDAARHDLAALGDVALQQPHVLVVDLRRIGAGERTGLAAAEERPAGLLLGGMPWRLLLASRAEGIVGALARRPAVAVAIAAVLAAVAIAIAESRRDPGRESRSRGRRARGRGRPCASSRRGLPRARPRER